MAQGQSGRWCHVRSQQLSHPSCRRREDLLRLCSAGNERGEPTQDRMFTVQPLALSAIALSEDDDTESEANAEHHGDVTLPVTWEKRP